MTPVTSYARRSNRYGWVKSVVAVLSLILVINFLTKVKAQQIESRRASFSPIDREWAHGTSDPALRAAIEANNYQAVFEQLGAVDPKRLRSDVLPYVSYDHKLNALRAFLDKGYDPNGVAGDGRPLLSAVSNGQARAAKLLLERKARPNVANANGLTTLYIAASRYGGSILVETLLNAGGDPNLLNLGAASPAPTHGARMRLPAPRGPLGIAVANNDLQTVRLLIEHGAKANAPEGQLSPLHAAVQAHGRRNRYGTTANTTEVMTLLLEHGARVDAVAPAAFVRDRSFVAITGTPLHLAVHKGDVESARILLRYGANPNFRNPDGKTPAEVARGEMSGLVR